MTPTGGVERLVRAVQVDDLNFLQVGKLREVLKRGFPEIGLCFVMHGAYGQRLQAPPRGYGSYERYIKGRAIRHDRKHGTKTNVPWKPSGESDENWMSRTGDFEAPERTRRIPSGDRKSQLSLRREE